MEFPMYPKEDAEREQAQADDRALWAVRVLDAWIKAHSTKTAPVAVPNPADGGWAVFVMGREFQGDDAYGARLAAADAVWPELPADVRARIGERP